MELSQDKIIEIISSITQKNPESILPTHTLRGDLGMDSMQALELMVVLEEDYQVVIPQTQATQIQTAEQLWSLIKMNKAGSC